MNLAPHILLIFKILKMISDIPLLVEVENKLDGIGLTSLSESSKISNVIDSFKIWSVIDTKKAGLPLKNCRNMFQTKNCDISVRS